MPPMMEHIEKKIRMDMLFDELAFRRIISHRGSQMIDVDDTIGLLASSHIVIQAAIDFRANGAKSINSSSTGLWSGKWRLW